MDWGEEDFLDSLLAVESYVVGVEIEELLWVYYQGRTVQDKELRNAMEESWTRPFRIQTSHLQTNHTSDEQFK